jgi:hypothetical protein
MRVLLLLLCALRARAFKLTSGPCQMYTPRPWPVVPHPSGVCVSQPLPQDNGTCTIEPPKTYASAALPLRVRTFNLMGGDSLLVNGVAFYNTSGPDGVKSSALIKWIPSSNSSTSEWEICRPLVPFWHTPFCVVVWWFAVVYGITLFFLQDARVFAAGVAGAIVGIVVGVVVLFLPYDGHVYGDWYLGTSISLPEEYHFDTVMFSIWFVGFGMIPFLVLVVLLFLYSRRLTAARTRKVEGDLVDRLQDGSIRLISVAWLLEQEPNTILPRRQELEGKEGALIDPSAAVRLLRAGRVGALSYKWLAAGHPDPNAFHMAAILALYRKFPFSFSRRRPEAMFWDYASLHQKDDNGVRTGDEDGSTFKKALRVMSNLYATPHTLVMQHKALPADFDFEHFPNYDQSGWCHPPSTLAPYTLILHRPPSPHPLHRCQMEQGASSLATEGGAASGSLYEIPHGYALGWTSARQSRNGWVNLTASERKTPEEMADIFSDKKRTTFVGNADRELVAEMYQKLHEKVLQVDRAMKPVLVRLSDALVARIGVVAERLRLPRALHGAGLAFYIYIGLSFGLFGASMIFFRKFFFINYILITWWGLTSFWLIPSRTLRDYAVALTRGLVRGKRRKRVQPGSAALPSMAPNLIHAGISAELGSLRTLDPENPIEIAGGNVARDRVEEKPAPKQAWHGETA